MRINLNIVMIFVLLCGGCTRLRFVVDAIPSDDELTESVVMAPEPRSLFDEPTAKIALIDLTGMIADARRSELVSDGENPIDQFVEALQQAKHDRNIKAVIIRLNSPGGTVTASDIVYREIIHFREQTDKPVVMLMGDVAASGAFYVACAGDHIIAHPTTITGSIGVIIQTFNFSQGMNRIGIRADAITSGPNKSMGSPFEPMSPEHRALLQGLVDEFYERFHNLVVDSRSGLQSENLDWVTDGRVITGLRAAEIGLVDQIGDLHDAFDLAKQRAQVQSAKLIKYHRPLNYVGSPYAHTPVSNGSQINLLQLNLDSVPTLNQVGFYYLWDPSAW